MITLKLRFNAFLKEMAVRIKLMAMLVIVVVVVVVRASRAAFVESLSGGYFSDSAALRIE